MARGFMSGVLWGGVLAVGTAGLTSVLAPPPMSPDVSDTAPGGARAPDRIDQPGSAQGAGAGDTTVITVPVTPQSPAPDPDTLSGLDSETTTSTERPRTGAADALDAPAASAPSGGVVVGAEAPVLPNPQALAPMAPQEADDVSISTEPAQPPAPAPEDGASAFAPPQQPPSGAEESAPQEEANDPAPQPEAVVASRPAEGDPAEAPAAMTPPPEAPEAGVVVPGAPPEPDASEDDAATGQAAADRPAIGEPAGTIGDLDTDVVIRRPGSETDADAETAQSPTAEGATDQPPIRRYAQDIEVPADKPLMSIVLIDDGSSPVSGATGIAALASFPYTLTFAVDATAPDASARMAVYRAAGFEVLAMVDLPEGAQPQDAETTLGVVLRDLPEVVGVLEGVGSGLQPSRAVADQVTEILLQSGHGLLTQDRGLNTMPQLARRAGVPADPIFRDFDSKGQTAQVIRRFLDQAAFKAGQEGAVVMLGRLRPDTISALLLWGLQDRASSVALVPISAVLLREEE